jgi:hypothetical protein
MTMSGTGRRRWWDDVRRDTDEEKQRPRAPAIGGVDRRGFVKGAACCLVAAVLPAGAAGPGRGEVEAAALPLPPEPLRLDVDDDMGWYRARPSYLLARPTTHIHIGPSRADLRPTHRWRRLGRRKVAPAWG